MFRKVAALAALALIPAMTGCGSSTSSQPTKTVTVAASSASPAPSTATPSVAPADAQTSAGDGSDPLALKKFGDSVMVPENPDVVYKVGVPKIVKPWSTEVSSESATDYGDEAESIVSITLTISNKGKTQYEIANYEDAVSGNYQTTCMADWPVPDEDSSTGMNTNPVNVKPGQSVDYTIHCGASKDGKLTMTIGADGFSTWATYSNESAPGQEP